MQHLLYIYPFAHTVVVEDEKLLRKHFSVRAQPFPSHRKLLIPLLLIRQLFLLLFYISKTDIVLVSFAGYHSLLPAILGRFLKKPVHIILHGAEVASIPSLRYGSLRKKWIKKIVEISISNATSILPVSKYLIESKHLSKGVGISSAQGLRTFFPKLKFEFNVIYNGLDPDFWAFPEDNSKNDTALIVAMAQPNQFERKGIDLLLEAAVQLKHISFKVLALKGHWTEKTLPANVEYLPFLPPQEVRMHFQKATVFLQISRWEGFGCALCEAMLCGCLPIVGNVNMLPEIAGNEESVLTHLNSDELTKTILQTLKTSSNSSKKRNGRTHIINKFHIDLREERLVNHLKSSIDLGDRSN